MAPLSPIRRHITQWASKATNQFFSQPSYKLVPSKVIGTDSVALKNASTELNNPIMFQLWVLTPEALLLRETANPKHHFNHIKDPACASYLSSVSCISAHCGSVTNMLMVTTTVGMLHRVHSHTTHFRPAVPLGLVLVVGTTSLQHGLVNTATTSDNTWTTQLNHNILVTDNSNNTHAKIWSPSRKLIVKFNTQIMLWYNIIKTLPHI